MAAACSVSRGRYSLGERLIVMRVSKEAFALGTSGVQNSVSSISMLNKLLIKSLFLAKGNNVMRSAVRFDLSITHAG